MNSNSLSQQLSYDGCCTSCYHTSAPYCNSYSKCRLSIYHTQVFCQQN